MCDLRAETCMFSRALLLIYSILQYIIYSIRMHLKKWKIESYFFQQENNEIALFKSIYGIYRTPLSTSDPYKMWALEHEWFSSGVVFQRSMTSKFTQFNLGTIIDRPEKIRKDIEYYPLHELSCKNCMVNTCENLNFFQRGLKKLLRVSFGWLSKIDSCYQFLKIKMFVWWFLMSKFT